MADKPDGVLDWAERQVKQWREAIKMMENGLLAMHEVRDGRYVDTTQEVMKEYAHRASELEALIAKHHNA